MSGTTPSENNPYPFRHVSQLFATWFPLGIVILSACAAGIELRLTHKIQNASLVVIVGSVIFGLAVFFYLRHQLRVLAARNEQVFQSMREGEDRLKRIAEASFDGLIIHQDGRIVDANPSCARMLRTSVDRLIGLPVAELPASQSAQREVLTHIASGFEKPYRTWIKRFDGTELRVEILGKACFFQSKPARIVAMHDLTEQTILEERFEGFFEQAPFAVNFYRPDGLCVGANPAWEKLWQIPREAVQGYNIKEDVHAQRDPVARQAIEKAFSSGSSIIPPTLYDPSVNRFPGRPRWIETFLFPLLSREGRLREVVGVVVDVTEREDLLERLRHALEIRDEFLSVASHELKTPLTPLTLRLQSMIEKLYAPAADHASLKRELLRLAEISAKQVRRLSELVDELLDISRIRSGKLSFRFAQADLVPVIRELVERYQPQAAQHGSDIELEIEGEEIVGDWDIFRIEQVAVNLISNAIKYGSGKPIRISLITEGDGPGSGFAEAVLTVSDQGIGISAEDQVKIFGRFERVSGSQNIPGLGLGLYIAHEIIVAHGGSIHVQSELGQGSTFQVRLPRTRAAAQ